MRNALSHFTAEQQSELISEIERVVTSELNSNQTECRLNMTDILNVLLVRTKGNGRAAHSWKRHNRLWAVMRRLQKENKASIKS